ncbi:hypothetical protein [Amycolatopsis alkalitolerans]|nr:hypothetical protein [Amycolatopsis alkalitolerans]
MRDHLGRCWRPEHETDCYCTADGRHHVAWRELHTLFDLVEVA